MIYYITNKDIREGLRGNCKKCPAARAIKRRHKGENVEVKRYSTCIGNKLYKNPPELTKFIGEFDTFILNNNVKPMKFKLEEV